MYIPTWILIIIIVGIGFYFYNKKRVSNPSIILNKRNPTYDEMLKLSEKEFQRWLLIRNETDKIKLLEEMIDHEERTENFRKTAKKEVDGAEQALIAVFDRNKSPSMVQTFGTVKDYTKIDLMDHAIFAKATSDYVGLGDKIEKERNKK